MKFVHYLGRRIVSTLFAIFGVMVLTFVCSHLLPSNPAVLWLGGPGLITKEAIEMITEKYHLNDPIHVQFYIYLQNLLKGDLGTSPVTNQPVLKELSTYFPHTVELMIVSFLITMIVGIFLGIISATKKDSVLDHFTRVFTLLGVSMPSFWLALLTQIVFYYQLRWLSDPGGRINPTVLMRHPIQELTGFLILDSLLSGNWAAFASLIEHLILPALTLAYISLAIIARITRAGMLEVLRQDYIRTARSAGLLERAVIYRYALKNAMIPTTTVLGLVFGSMIAGSVVIETVFYWPGMGRYAYDSILSLDFPGIMGFVLVASIIYVLSNLIVDLIYGFIDPRVRYG